MYEVVIGKVKGLIFTKDKVKKNSIIAPIIRFVVLALGFLVVKLAYPYLDQTRYGVWMTILSIFNMLIVVDLGISNGLRNKLTEAYANNDSVKAKEYVSTAYVLFGIFIFILMVISFFVVRLFDYSVIFNVDKTIGSELKFLMSIAIPLFLLSFYFSLLNAVMYAKHDSALYDFRAFIFNLLYIPTILLIKRFSYNSIFYLASSYLVATNLSYIFLSVYLFKKKYRDIIPSLKNVKFVYMKDLLNVGVTFLFVQLSSLILMSADNIVITQFLGPQYVSVYQIVNKPFLVVYILFTGVTAPLWSAFTHHYAQKDVDWISNTIKKMIQFLIPIAIFLFVIALALKLLIYLWIGRELDYSLTHVIFIAYMLFN